MFEIYSPQLEDVKLIPETVQISIRIGRYQTPCGKLVSRLKKVGLVHPYFEESETEEKEKKLPGSLFVVDGFFLTFGLKTKSIFLAKYL